MHINMTITLGPGEELTKPVKAAPRAVLRAVGGDPANDSINISVTQNASISNTTPPPTLSARPAKE